MGSRSYMIQNMSQSYRHSQLSSVAQPLKSSSTLEPLKMKGFDGINYNGWCVKKTESWNCVTEIMLPRERA